MRKKDENKEEARAEDTKKVKEPTSMRVRLTFVEPILGTAPANKDVYRDFIASKAADTSTPDDELSAIDADAKVEKSMTIFPKTEGGVPFLYDYQIKGFFKGACGFLRKADWSYSSNLKAFKKEIDGLIFPEPRRILFQFPGYAGARVGDCQRPLRANTAQGERTSLAISEEIPAGSTVEFTVVLLADHEKFVREWLDFGKYSGIGQWRNSGKGRFLWEELDQDGNAIGGNLSEAG